MTILNRFLMLTLSVLTIFIPVSAQSIRLWADAEEGVELVGAAKRGRPMNKFRENLERQGLGDRRVVELGQWSKRMTEPCRALFSPEIPSAGLYDVYVSLGNQAVRAKQADPLRVTVRHAGGERTFRPASYTDYTGIFLGTYRLEAGGGPVVVADAEGSFGSSTVMGIRLEPARAEQLAERPKVLPATPGESDAFDRMRLAFAERMTLSAAASVDDPLIAEVVARELSEVYLWWKTMDKTPEALTLWPDLPVQGGKPIEKNEGGGWPLTRTFDRVTDLARAYVGAHAGLGYADKMRGNPELLADILYALEYLYKTRYNERSVNKFGAEWIGMEVSNPANIASTLLLLYPEVPAELMRKQVATMEAQSPGPDKMYGNFPSTGFNRLNGVYAFALRSVLTRDGEALERIVPLIEREFLVLRRSELEPGPDGKVSPDGYYADGSFIQHGAFPYIGIYGRGLLERYGNLTALLAGSPWEIRDPRAEVFYDWVTRGYAPLFFGGEIMYGSLGRSTGQSWHQNGTVSSEILNALVPLVEQASSARRDKLKGVLKAWVLDKRDAAYPEFSRFDLNKLSPDRLLTLDRWAEDRAIEPVRPEPGTTLFYNTDYLAHHQPDFAVQLRMYSTRIKTHEDINEGTNRLGWYQAEGALFLYDRDNSRYNDHYWATVDPYRLPGTTVDKRPREHPGSKNGEFSESAWAGGVTLDGFGLAGMELSPRDSSLHGYTSWFFLGDRVLALGAGIESADGHAVETIVANLKLHGEGAYPFTVNGAAQPGGAGWSAELPGSQWAHVKGQVPGTDVGWVFPGGADLRALREERSGSWTDSFKNDADSNTYTRRFLTLWMDHGLKPDNASYAYAMLPGRTAEQTAAWAASPDIEILENSPRAQAARSTVDGVTAVNFWNPEPHAAAGIASSGQAAVMLRELEGELRIAVSDPTQLGSRVQLRFDREVGAPLDMDDRVTVESLRPLTVSVDFTNSDGAPIRARFQR